MLQSSIMLSVISLFGNFVSLANQLVIAKKFGASSELDAYFIGISWPVLVSGALSGAINYTLVPALIARRSPHSDGSSSNGLLVVVLVALSLGLAGAGYLWAPSIHNMVALGLGTPLRSEAAAVERIAWLSAGASLVISVLGAVHNSVLRFKLPALAVLFPFVGMISLELLFGASMGPLAIAWGMLLGSLLVIPVLLPVVLSELELSVRISGNFREVFGYLSGIPVAVLAMICFTVYQAIDAYWAPRLGPGSLACMGYCQRILIGMGTLIVTGPSVILIPRLARAHAEGRVDLFLDDLGRAVRLAIFLSAPAAVLVATLAGSWIELLLQRGRFDEHSTRMVASVLPLMMVGMVGMLAVVVLFRAFFARRDTIRPAVLGCLGAGLYFGLSGLLSASLSIRGLALAYAASWWIVLVVSICSLWKSRFESFFSASAWKGFVGVPIALAVEAVVAESGRSWLVQPLHEAGFLRLALETGTVSLAASGVFYLTSIYWFKVPDLVSFSDSLSGLVFKRKLGANRPQASEEPAEVFGS